MGLLVKSTAPPEFWQAIGKSAADYPDISLASFFAKNLLPVTLGNIVGGSVLVGLVYGSVYLRKRPEATPR